MDTDRKTVRETGPDVLRTVAVIFVISVHFYLNCGYYSEPMVGEKMFVMTAARWLFLTCVPIFVMLTGYFKCNKTVSKSHYMSLIPLFISYLVISVIKIGTYNVVHGGIYDLKTGLQAIGNYSIAWYMGMYLSLMLICPFLNYLWKAIPNKKEKYILLGSLAFVACLYPICLYVAPSYWQMLYPLLYYFLGCFIREYRPHFKKWILVLIAAVLVIAEAVISFVFAKGGAFQWMILGPTDSGYSTITVVVCAACIFLFLYDVQVSNRFLAGFFKLVSSVSFEMYMFTGCVDIVIFYYLKQHIYTGVGFFWWIFATVPVSFIISLVLSYLFKKLLSLLPLNKEGSSNGKR